MRPVYFENDKLVLIDQTKLPNEEIYHRYDNYRDICAAISNMIVRGAPAIGVTAAYGLYFGALKHKNENSEAFQRTIVQIGNELKATRPTAVNLSWAVDRMLKVATENSDQQTGDIISLLLAEAHAICAEDIAMCKAMGRYGAALFEPGDTILTHCNAGALATADYGTALGVIRAAQESGKNISVFADETRPLLQGARLTAYELHQDGIPVTLITDNMAGWMMKSGKIDRVIVGADRIAANGDTANKIGTYSLSILAKYHNIPFYVAAPTSTIDFEIESGDAIIIEERNPEEVTHIAGNLIAPEGITVENPAFDVTPFKNITAIITEKGLVYPPYDVNIPELRFLNTSEE